MPLSNWITNQGQFAKPFGNDDLIFSSLHWTWFALTNFYELLNVCYKINLLSNSEMTFTKRDWTFVSDSLARPLSLLQLFIKLLRLKVDALHVTIMIMIIILIITLDSRF